MYKNIKHTLEEAKSEYGIKRILYVKSAVHDGVWYKNHIGEYFYYESDVQLRYKAITCLSKEIEIPEWADRLYGWFGNDDVIEITEKQYIRENKLNKIGI